jgi:ketosteroid isomerase-like protein
MKKILISLFVIALLGCTNQVTKPLTDVEKATLIKEVTETGQSAIEAYNKIDFQTVKSCFLDSPDFIAVSADGSILNYEQKINDTKSFFESISSLHFTVLNKEVKVLEKDLAIYTVQIKVDATIKTGEKLTYEKLTVTEIYKKVDNQWKVTFFQESGLPPAMSGS